MDFTPILIAPIEIKIHLFTALGALVVTPFMLIMRKGTWAHKRLGRVWVVLMALTAMSALWISEIQLWGRWSPIHILCVVTLLTLFYAIRFARAGRISGHRRAITGAMAGLLGAGIFTFFPGRLLSIVFLG